MPPVPSARILADDRPPRPEGEYILYWMVAARRTRRNAALERAVELARELRRPLLVLEPLRIDYRFACRRFHQFVVEGMADQARAFAARGVAYHPYVERASGEGSGLVEALAARAAAVVTDHWPCSFVPRMQEAARSRLSLRFERVDGNGLLPIAVSDRAHGTAYSFRRFLQRELPRHLAELPLEDPLAQLPAVPPACIPPEVLRRWPAATAEELARPETWLGALPIDHEVGVARRARARDAPRQGALFGDDVRQEETTFALRGGERSALARLDEFLDTRLERYAEERNSPETPVTSGLSPWLHFGHIAAAEVFSRVAEREAWTPEALSRRVDGARAGWWGMSESAEAYLDQLVTWRELGFVLCTFEPRYDRFESLPAWALRTLEAHAGDPREPCYTLEELERAATHDPLWNAAQEQLRREGTIHNYLRMLWGKKVLHWAGSPREAFEILVELNDKYALDGRDPNSYTSIGWIFGRYDRPWGPERPIFGSVRYMSSENTGRKLRVRDYVREYAPR